MICSYSADKTFIFDAYRLDDLWTLFAVSQNHRFSLSLNVRELTPEIVISFVRSLAKSHDVQMLVVDRSVTTIGAALEATKLGITVLPFSPRFKATAERMSQIMNEAS